MFALIVQTVLLFTITFILGCLVGAGLRLLFTGSGPAAEEEKTDAPAAASLQAARNVAGEGPVVPPTPAMDPLKRAEAQTPKARAVPKPAPAGAGKKDNLKRINGIGPQNERKLNALGVTTFAQIAGWSNKDAEDYGEALAFPGRIEREDWIAQAKQLANGDSTPAVTVTKTTKTKTGGATAASGDGTTVAGLASPRDGTADPLTAINGLGPALEKKLNKLGVYHFDQMASLTPAQQARLGDVLGFPGRVERENWVAEAGRLARGEQTAAVRKPVRGDIRPKSKS